MEPKRRGWLIFLLVFLVVAGGISATVLMANDKRNLDIVLRQLGFETTRRLVIPKPGAMEAFKGKRIGGGTVLLPANLFVAPVLPRSSDFLRSFVKDGDALCKALRKAGFDMTKWEAGAFAKTVLECSFESRIANPDKPDDASTFYMIVRGLADGEILSARIKFVFTSAAQQPLFAKRAADMLVAVARHTNWLELEEEARDVAALKPFKSELAGVGVSFSAEFSGAGRYNLIVASAPLKPAERRTQDYFARAKYWPLLPEHGGPAPKISADPPEG